MILLHVSEILICLQVVNFFLGAISHSINKKTLQHLYPANHRWEQRAQRHFSGMETSVREIRLKSCRTGDLSLLPVLSCMCCRALTKGRVLLFCNSPSKPIVQCQQRPLPANRNENGISRQMQGRQAQIYCFLIHLLLFQYMCCVFTSDYLLQGLLWHCVTCRNTVHQLVMVIS